MLECFSTKRIENPEGKLLEKYVCVVFGKTKITEI